MRTHSVISVSPQYKVTEVHLAYDENRVRPDTRLERTWRVSQTPTTNTQTMAVGCSQFEKLDSASESRYDHCPE